MGLPPSQQTACCVFKIDQEWIRIMIGKSQGTDHYLLSGWVHGCMRVGWGGGEGEYRPLLEPVRSQNCKIPPVHELEKKGK